MALRPDAKSHKWYSLLTGIFLLLFASVVNGFAQDSDTESQESSLQNENNDTVVSLGLFEPDSSGVALNFGYLWIGQSYPTSPTSEAPNTDGIRASGLIGLVGFSVRIAPDVIFRLAPGLEVTFDEYVYREDLERAFPTQSSTGSSVGPVASVMGLLLTVPWQFEIPIASFVLLELSPGLAAYVRIPTEALDESEGIEAIGEYLNREAKWLYPFVSVGMKFGLSSWLSADFRFRAFFPLWHAWDSEDLPFWDNLMFNLDFGLIFHL